MRVSTLVVMFLSRDWLRRVEVGIVATVTGIAAIVAIFFTLIEKAQ